MRFSVEAMSETRLPKRVEELAREWNVLVRHTFETPSSFVAFGLRGPQEVVLKVIRGEGDEWLSGEALEAFNGRGTVRVYEHVGGAVLLERLKPGTPLTALALEGRDDEATEILAEVIERMSGPRPSSKAFVRVEDWARGFERYLESGDEQIPVDLVAQAARMYMRLCASQQRVRLLHGDLQHYNVLLDSERGWVAIDPKGVIGEVEYEIGASLRNPYERPDLFTAPEAIERRIRLYEARLKLNPARALAWAFSQAVLSAIWSVEDEEAFDADNPSMKLALAIRPLLE